MTLDNIIKTLLKDLDSKSFTTALTVKVLSLLRELQEKDLKIKRKKVKPEVEPDIEEREGVISFVKDWIEMAKKKVGFSCEFYSTSWQTDIHPYLERDRAFFIELVAPLIPYIYDECKGYFDKYWDLLTVTPFHFHPTIPTASLTFHEPYFLYLSKLFKESERERLTFIWEDFIGYLTKNFELWILAGTYAFTDPLPLRMIDNIKSDFNYLLKDHICNHIANVVMAQFKRDKIAEDLWAQIDKQPLTADKKSDSLRTQLQKLASKAVMKRIEGDDSALVFEWLYNPFLQLNIRNEYMRFGSRFIKEFRGIGDKVYNILNDDGFRLMGQIHEVIEDSPDELLRLEGIGEKTLSLLKEGIDSFSLGAYYHFPPSTEPLESKIRSKLNEEYIFVQVERLPFTPKIPTPIEAPDHLPFDFQSYIGGKERVEKWKVYNFEEYLPPPQWKRLKTFMKIKGGRYRPRHRWGKYDEYFYFTEQPDEETLKKIAEKYYLLLEEAKKEGEA